MRRLFPIGLATLVLAGTAGAERRSGQLISFWTDRGPKAGVWVMNADGSDQRLVTGDVWAKRGSFSPDGARLVFDGPVVVGGRIGWNFDVYVSNTDGSALHRITSGPQRDVLAKWSPNGRWIAFSRGVAAGGVDHVWLVHPDGTGLHRLRVGAGPQWSPDGTRIAFAEPRGSIYGISVMRANGCCVRRLTGSAFDAAPGDWSPDGHRILFTRWETNRGEVWVMNADGTGQRRLTRNPADDFDPTWSPDGTKVLFTSDRAGSKDVWVMNADGTGPQRLTTASSEDWATDWQP